MGLIGTRVGSYRKRYEIEPGVKHECAVPVTPPLRVIYVDAM